MNGHPTRAGWFWGSTCPCEPVTPPRGRTYRLVLLGPPGVGKGTQAELLCRRLRTCHLSTGDLFRAAMNETQPSPAMELALGAMRRGELVSDELVMSLVRERSACLRCDGGFLLDGIPRTVQQAESLDALLRELGVTLDAVLAYDLPLEEIVDRIGGRRTCAQCKAVFHLSSRPPAQSGRCDQCGAQLQQRDDDRPAAVRVRMEAYTAATQPLHEFYAQRGQLITIDAHGTPDEIFDESIRWLDQHLKTVAS